MVCLRNKTKKLYAFGVEGEVNVFIGKFLEVFCVPIALFIKTESFQCRFLRILLSDYVFPVIGN